MNDKTDTRTQILEAAMNRIVHYGYGKTTMSEIAGDCGMSAGNIYRFFASKIDIAEAMARKFNTELYQAYAEIARSDDPAPARLRAFFEYGLTHTYDAIEKDAKILEVAEVLRDERPLFFNEGLAQERIYLMQILEDGMEAGTFAPMQDPGFISEMIQSALMKFRFPQLYSLLTQEKLKRELNGVLDILIAGLKHGVEITVETKR
ncbi:TetR/AcrR family transcriptional regulator [Henriciella aquimarina]|uniref:TetR/AcrR family transcriptional regulator n=1 Tax=Henriciella aquimarina TaxID=545261 RepID=UPI000A04AE9D|nr:TetR/AcrR family transcriptional regulator [Henriciella aquimarina]